MSPSPRLDLKPLTSVRGFAAIIVVVYHFAGGFLPAIDPAAATGLVAKGYLWVDFFFILSGFIIAHAYTETFRHRIDWPAFRSFVEARFARIYPLHLLILGGFVALEIVKLVLREIGWGVRVDAPFAGGASPEGLVLNVLMLQTSGLQEHLTWNGPAWSVGAEFAAYLVFPVLSLVIMRLGGAFRLGLAVAAMVGLWAISSNGTNLDRTADFGILRCAMEFMLGVLAYRLFAECDLRPVARSLPLAVLAAMILAAMHFEAPDIVFPIAFSTLVVGLAANQGLAARLMSRPWMVWLGTISYSIYMSHYLVMHVVQVASRAVMGSGVGRHFDAVQSGLFLVALCGLVVMLSWALYVLFEAPTRDMLRRRLRKA